MNMHRGGVNIPPRFATGFAASRLRLSGSVAVLQQILKYLAQSSALVAASSTSDGAVQLRFLAELLCARREDLDVAVAARLDLEVARVGLAGVSRDDAVEPLGKRHGGEGADRFLHDVAPR